MQALQSLIQPFSSNNSPIPSPSLPGSALEHQPSYPTTTSSASSTTTSVASDSDADSTHPTDAFHTLVSDLSAVLGPCSGLDSDDVDPKDIMSLMEGYTSNEEEWSRYAFADGSRGYTRNLVDEGNGKSNLVSCATVQLFSSSKKMNRLGLTGHTLWA